MSIRSKIKVLLIDDSPISLILKEYLEDRSYSVTSCFDGKQGITKLQNADYNFDLIICDYNMPGVFSGEDVFCRALSCAPELKNKFLFITGDYSPTVINFFKRNSCEVLMKPFFPNQIIDYIDSMLKNSKLVATV